MSGRNICVPRDTHGAAAEALRNSYHVSLPCPLVVSYKTKFQALNLPLNLELFLGL